MKKFCMFLSVILVLSLLAFLVSCGGEEKENRSSHRGSESYTTHKEDSSQRIEDSSNRRAISLRVLQKRLKAHHAEGNYPEELLQLAGIKRITGYVVDSPNNDIILIGEVDNQSPSLYLEDFVIALRNAWLRYAELRGNTYYYSNPGCSIDPNPQVVQKLNIIGQQILSSSSPSVVERHIDNWHSTCQLPQRVRVMGIPFRTRFAWVMVKADYDMKRLVDGYDSLNIPGFISLADMMMEKAEEDIINGRPISIPFSSMNRFWFYPGENLYVEDEGVVVIKQSPVILLTEEEYLTKRGEIVGSGRPNPLAQNFAESFSARYAEVAKQRPIYIELENLFRFVALAKIMKFKSSHEEAGLDLDYLLSHYRVSRTSVDEEKPGRSNVKRFEHRQDFTGGYQIARLWLPTCGGVGLDIEVSRSNFDRDTTGKLSELRTKVLSTRPSSQSLFWSFLIKR